MLTFRVLLVEGADVEGVCCVHLSPGRYQRGRVLLLVDLVPVHSAEEGVILQLVGAAAPTAETLVDVALKKEYIENKS